MRFQIIDTTNNNAVVAEYPTHRRALNASRKLESEPSVDTGRRYARGGMGKAGTRIFDWRYQIRPVQVATCKWFLKCTRPASVTLPHPILGDVPTCKECAEKVARLSR